MLEPSADEIREWGNSVTQFMIDYLAGLRDRPVYRHTSSRGIRSELDSELPIKGTDFDSLLKVFRDTIVPFSRQNAHPRMFGYVQSPGTPIGAFADLLASTLNANLTIWRSAPAPVELERLTIDWIRQILGFNPEADGLFVSGGSMANLAVRALKVWMLLKGVGLARLSDAIESNLACARHLESMVRASDDFEMVAPVELSIFCFRHVPAQLRNQPPEAIDAFNERLLVDLQRDGSSYLSNATLGGRFALRGCGLNYRTTLRDMEILLDDLRRVGRLLPNDCCA
jgi:glutamate/tyrosine decarboxylase-like PLP-dependent enzyme